MHNTANNRKLIHIFSPVSGMEFKVELNGSENSLRELLGAILEIPSTSIKGIKDSYNNYYTLSSALKSKHINTEPNNCYTVIFDKIINNNNNYNFKNNKLDPFNYNINNSIYGRGDYYLNNRFINDDNLFYNNNKINNVQNIQNFEIRKNFYGNNFFRNYMKNDYYYLINLLYKNNYIDNNNYFKLKKCIDINNQDVLEIMKPFIELDDNYDKLINNLFPILNLDLTINDDVSLKKHNSMSLGSYKEILNKIKGYFSSSNMKQLNYLLLMENIEIIKIIRSYLKTNDKKELIKNLHYLLNENKKKILSSKFNNYGGNSKITKERKSRSQNINKISKKANDYINNKTINKEQLNDITNKIIEYGKKFSKDIYYLMKLELKYMSDDNKKVLFSQFNIDADNIGKNKFVLNNTNKKSIKKYYNKYLNTNIYKFLNEDEKNIYKNIIEEPKSEEYQELMKIYSEMCKDNKSKNKIELLRNKIINYIKEIIEQNEEENEEEKEESKESNNDKEKKSKNSEESDEEDNSIKIQTNEEGDDDDTDKKNDKNKGNALSFDSSTIIDVDDEDNDNKENVENYSDEESGVSIRKANRPKKNQ